MLPTIPSLRQPEYQISNSLRFRSSASAYLSRTLGTPTNNKIWTYSAWVKRGSLSADQRIFSAYDGTSAASGYIIFNADNTISVNTAGTNQITTTTAVYRDTSAWYHIVVSVNMTAATQIVYVNNVQVGSFAVTNVISQINQVGLTHKISSNHTSTHYFDGYLAEVYFVDGQALTPAAFGATSSKTGVWSPRKYLGTYGTNGFYLKFADNSAATAAAIGKDSSGNSNNWTPTNISMVAGVAYDSMTDTPTPYADGVNGRGNYCTLNPLVANTASFLSQGNLALNGQQSANGTITVFSGKWYFEYTIANGPLDAYIGVGGTSSMFYRQDGTRGGASWVAYGASYTQGDIIGCAFDCDAATVTFYKNNVSQGQITGLSLTTGLVPSVYVTTSQGAWVNFGQRPFAYTPPTGFKALNTYNLPDPAIVHGHAYMAATTYTGTGVGRNISNFSNNRSFRPDLVWIKSRSNATNHALYDTLRGAQQDLVSNSTATETTQSTGLTAFNEDGFGLSTLTKLNSAGNTYVAWQWKAGDGVVTNTAGSITSQVDANPATGFSVVTYTGTGANATVGHGLGVAPKMVIVRCRNSSFSTSWIVWHSAFINTEYIQLNVSSGKQSDATMWNSTAPSSTVLSIGTANATNESTKNIVAYCFAEIAGYSKFGSYTGNSSSDGPFVFCNFRPKFIMAKRTDSAENWFIVDSTCSPTNQNGTFMSPNDPTILSVNTLMYIDILSNGFKMRGTGQPNNNSGTYIYAAFAEVPSKYALAR